MGPARGVLLWASRSRWIESRMRSLPSARRAVARFLPGESLNAALPAAAELQRQGRPAVLTYLGENVTTADRVEGVVHQYQELLDRACRCSAGVQISVKPTQLGLDLDPDLCAGAVRRLATHAATRRTLVWIDMESSAYVDRTLALYQEARRGHDNVGLCLQAYLRRTAQDLDRLLEGGAAIRLVKGAYSEPRRRAFSSRREVDLSFLDLAERLLRARRDGARGIPVLGTHDPRILRQVARRADRLGLARRDWEVHMLYGIRTRDQQRMTAAGHVVRVLISYGEAWFPWYMRRLAERPANVVFAARSLLSR